MFYKKEKGKYGLLFDGTIVRITSWTEAKETEIQDIYFDYYYFIDRIKYKRKNAFAFHTDFLVYKDTVKELKRYWKNK